MKGYLASLLAMATLYGNMGHGYYDNGNKKRCGFCGGEYEHSGKFCTKECFLKDKERTRDALKLAKKQNSP